MLRQGETRTWLGHDGARRGDSGGETQANVAGGRQGRHACKAAVAGGFNVKIVDPRRPFIIAI